ncbi:hypothetical protein HMPREF1986_01522 [Oribacterium sp. oral taxon 078 str. F0263]|nr:hypothetical protein HMPREF1986_01522 [Oribacterium sp. oral taxon 078 str. F0263]
MLFLLLSLSFFYIFLLLCLPSSSLDSLYNPADPVSSSKAMRFMRKANQEQSRGAEIPPASFCRRTMLLFLTYV